MLYRLRSRSICADQGGCVPSQVHEDSLWIAAGNVIEWTEEELRELEQRGWDWPEFPKGVWAKGDVWRLGKSAARL